MSKEAGHSMEPRTFRSGAMARTTLIYSRVDYELRASGGSWRLRDFRGFHVDPAASDNVTLRAHRPPVSDGAPCPPASVRTMRSQNATAS
jgi:hypothetical protein